MMMFPEVKRKIRPTLRILRFVVLLIVALFLLGGSIVPPRGLSSQVRAETRPIEFAFGTWTLDAVARKLSNWSLSFHRFISPNEQRELVLAYLDQVQCVQALNLELLLIFTDPTINNPEEASLILQEDLAQAEERLSELAPAAESVLQSQLMTAVRDTGLGLLGQVFPPSLYQTSDPPHSLVVSPRDEIRQALDISLSPALNADEMEDLETFVLDELDHSALVVPVGGIGTYPTMVMQTADLVWLTEVIAHEWVHNYLTLRPLGMNYYTNSELRTINETTASLAGKELGLMILEKYYPEFVPVEVESSENHASGVGVEAELDPPAFDFRGEMRMTRVEVDRLLAMGEVEEAEAYMEARREFFWENGYSIRKLNQAYFAFYGAYNDVPGGGAAGEDPVGPAVVTYRSQFESLADFLKAISWVDSFDELLGLLEN
jgi:hypothetical protein